MLTISGIIVDSSRIKLGRGVASSAVDLTLNTALTHYDSVLKEIYGLFAMSQTVEDLDKNLEAYFKKTIMGSNIPEDEADEYTRQIMETLRTTYPEVNDDGFSDFLKIDYSNFSFEKIPNSQLSNPEILKKQIVDFMKYRGPISMGMGFFQSLKSFNNLEKKQDVIEKKTKYYEAQSDVTKICKEIYELIEEYLKISSTEEDEIGMGITNEYLNEFSNKMNSLKSNYEGYNKSLVMDLYDNSYFYSIEYDISGSSGSYNVEYLEDVSLIKGAVNKAKEVKDKISNVIDNLFGDSNNVSTVRSEFRNSMRKLNSINDLLKKMENTNRSDLYNIQFVSQYNKSNHGEIIDEIHSWFLIYEEELGKEEPETNIKDTSEYDDYVKVMEQAVKINEKASKAYDSVDKSYLANEKNRVTSGLSADANAINAYRNNIDYANGLLENAIEKCDDLKDAIASLESSKDNWEDSLNKCPEGEEFTTSTRAELDNISELFNVDEVEELENRLSEISDVLGKVLEKVDEYKYGSKKLYEISSVETLKGAVNIGTIPIVKSELESLQKDVFASNYVSGNLERIDDDIDFRKTPLKFYTYLQNSFAGKEEDEDKEDEFKESRSLLAKDSKNSVEEAKEGNVKNTFEFNADDLNLPSGKDGELISEYETVPDSGGIPEGEAEISTGGSKDLKKDGARNALSNNNGFIKNMFYNFGDILKTQGSILRNNLYVIEYIMKMFSYDTFENEIRYTFPAEVKDEEGNSYKRESLLGMIGLNQVELNDEQKEKAITLTTYPINEENNVAYLSEVEYIIFGKEKSSTNVAISYSSIFGIRFTLNSIYAFTNVEIRNLSLSIATPISAASMGVLPVPLVQAVIQIGLALAETSHDMLELKNGMPVPIYKNKDTWRMSASSIAEDFTKSATDFAINKAAGAMKDAAKELVDESANFLQEVLDKTDEELTNLTDTQLGNLERSLKSAFNAIIDDAAGGVIIMVTEACSKAVEQANAKGEDARDMIAEVEAKLRENFNGYIAAEKIPELKEVKEMAVNYMLEDSTGYIENLIEKMQNRAQEDIEKVAVELQELSNDMTQLITGRILSGAKVFNEYKDKAIDEIKGAIENGQTALKDSIDSAFDKFSSSVGSDYSGLNAGNPATSIYSFKYSDYLRLFLLIGLYTNSDGIMRRVADVIQVNINENSDHAADEFKMSQAYTYARISADIEVKPIIIAIPLIADTIKDEDTDTRWYKFNYSGIAGY